MANPYSVTISLQQVHVKGQLIRCACNFKDSGGVDIDPTGVVVTVFDPDLQSHEYTYGTDPEVVKDAVGNYHIDISGDELGVYKVWWRSSVEQAANKSWFHVIAGDE